MTPQESRLLHDFLGQLTQVRGIRKDPEADAEIARAVAQQPDAAYLLVQRALLQDQALETAQAELARLRREIEKTGGQQSAASFLDASNAWGHSAGRTPHPEAQSAVMQAAPTRFGAQDVAPPAGAARPGLLGAGGSFLGNLAATAAGVAGGAFLFQGLQNLLNQHQEHEGPAQNPQQNHFMDSLGPSDAAQSSPLPDDSSPHFGADFADSADPGSSGADTDFGGTDDGTSI